MARDATAALLLAGLLACAGGSAGGPDTLPMDETPEGVRIRLLFREDADLDLHVTDPLQETVYFANSPSVSGGTLVADVRCDSEGARLEEVSWEAPPPGRYRVGVDYPIRCTGSGAPAPFILEIWADGIRHERRGALSFGRFEPIVYEFEVKAADAARTPGAED
jgi:hypothetical protein